MSGLVTAPDRYRLNKFNKRVKQHEINSFFATASPLMANYYKMSFSKTYCDVLPDSRNAYIYFTIFYTIVVIIMPLVIISLFNTLLILRLYRSNDQWTTTKLEMHEQELSYKELREKKVQIENLKITWTLIIISVSFIVLTLPYVIMYFVDKIYGRTAQKQQQKFFSYLLTKIADLFYMLNHSVNFFLYVLSRNSFRRVLKEKLKCECFNVRNNNNHSNNYTHGLNTHPFERKFNKWLTAPHLHLNHSPSSPSPANTDENKSNNNKNNKSKSSNSGGGLESNGEKNAAAKQQLLQVQTPPQAAVSRESYEQYWDTYKKDSVDMLSMGACDGVGGGASRRESSISTATSTATTTATATVAANKPKCSNGRGAGAASAALVKKNNAPTTVLKFDLLKKRMKANK